MLLTGSGTDTFPRRGFVGSIGTGLPSALVRRGLRPGKAVDEAALDAHAQRVLMIKRFPLRERNQRPVELNVTAQAGNFIGDKQALAPMRADGAINGAETKRRRQRTC